MAEANIRRLRTTTPCKKPFLVMLNVKCLMGKMQRARFVAVRKVSVMDI